MARGRERDVDRRQEMRKENSPCGYWNVGCLVQGILGCDLVGFHIEDYCINFIDCCQRGLGCRVDKVGTS